LTPSHIDPENERLRGLDPSQASTVAWTADALRTLINSLRSKFTICYNNWTAPGQNDPDNFSDFCSHLSEEGKKEILYLFELFHGHASLSIVIRTIPADMSRGAGAQSTDMRSSTTKRGGRSSHVRAADVITSAIGGPVTESAKTRARTLEENTTPAF